MHAIITYTAVISSKDRTMVFSVSVFLAFVVCVLVWFFFAFRVLVMP